MISLILVELKKIFQNKILLLILLAIIVLPPILVPALDEHNRTTERTRQLEQQDAYLSHYQGDLLDETFIKKVEEEYQKDVFITQLDPSKIETKYGKRLTYQEVYEKIGELDESFFYDTEEDRYRYYDLSYQSSGIGKLYHLKEKLSKSYYEEHEMAKYEFEQDRPLKEIQEQEKFNQQLDSMQHIYVGNTLSFEHLFSVLNIVAFALSFFFLFLTPSIMNREGKVLGLIKTTKRGKRQIAVAKILTMILLSILIPLICTLFTTLVIHIRYGLSNWKVTAMLVSDSYLFYSIFIFYIKRLFLMMLGCFGMSVVGTFLSSIFKNSYVSLGAMILFYIVWMFSSDGSVLIGLKNFTPMNILVDGYRNVLEFGNLSILNHLFSFESVIYIFWIVASIFLFYLSYVAYKGRQVMNES